MITAVYPLPTALLTTLRCLLRKGAYRLKSAKKQTQQAVEAIESLEQGKTHPTDFVSRWEARPPSYNYDVKQETTRFVPLDQIVGTEDINTDRLVPKRLVNALRLLVEGEYNIKLSIPPDLAKVDGKYYVSNDGTHRVLAHKIVGLSEIYADVTVYKPKNSP